MFTPILAFRRLFVFEFGARAGRRETKTDRQTNGLMDGLDAWCCRNMADKTQINSRSAQLRSQKLLILVIADQSMAAQITADH